MMNTEVENRAAGIKLLILDVDGVFTDGRVYYGSRGEELKAFHVRDGSALVRGQQAGLKVALVSGRKSGTVARRARELGIVDIYQGIIDKVPVMEELMARHSFRPEEIAYAGDDVADLPVLRRAGFAIAVADAHPLVLKVAHYRTLNRGGAGAVMEMVELILNARKT
ncbi:MAG: HAD hydrolase family protein [PVC group bacterium]